MCIDHNTFRLRPLEVLNMGCNFMCMKMCIYPKLLTKSVKFFT